MNNRMVRFLLISLLLTTCLTITAQKNFVNSYGFHGYNKGIDIVHHTNGYLVGGNSSDQPGQTQIYLVKINNQGETLWDLSYFKNNITTLHQLKLFSPDSIVLAGSRHASNNDEYEYFVSMVDSSGNIYWEESFGGEGWQQISSLRLHNNKIIAGGYTLIDSIGYYQPVILKINNAGTIVSKYQLASSSSKKIHSIDMIGDSVILAAGALVNDTTNKKNGYFVLLDTNLNILTDSVLTDTVENELFFAQWNDPFIVAGGYQTINQKAKQNWHIMINPFTPKQRSFIGSRVNDNIFTDMTITRNDNFYFTGFIESFGGGNKDILISIHNKNGYWKDSYTKGSSEDETGNSIITDDSNRIIICGTSNSWGPDFSNIFVFHGDSANKNVNYQDHYTDIHVSQKSGNINVYPNPFSSQLNIRQDTPFRQQGQKQNIYIYDIRGKLVFREKLNLNVNQIINLDNLEPGLYILEIPEITFRKKIIKQ
ncbi:MAG: T9SS type A sorting domain-containing protein [Bacteroidales bacterium]